MLLRKRVWRGEIMFTLSLFLTQEGDMEHKQWRIILAVVSALALTGLWADAQQLAAAAAPAAETKKPAAGAAHPDLEERAVAMLRKANDFLVQAQHFSVTADMGYDSVQASGLKVEFGATRKY